MKPLLLASIVALTASAPAFAGPQEDWLLSIYYSSSTPAYIQKGLEYSVKVIEHRRRLETQGPGQISNTRPASTMQSQSAVVQVAPALAAQDFSLRSIYAFPNPAVAGQKPTIHVSVGVADKVTFRFYDISGQLLHQATIDSPPSQIDDGTGAHPAYEYSWEGHIPSGVYLYSVTAEKAGQAPIRQSGKSAVVR